MLYARDKLFVSTGRKAILTCGTADGNITSVTAPNQELSENGQANFGSVGADYVSAAEHAMAVEIDGIYILFLTRDGQNIRDNISARRSCHRTPSNGWITTTTCLRRNSWLFPIFPLNSSVRRNLP